MRDNCIAPSLGLISDSRVLKFGEQLVTTGDIRVSACRAVLVSSLFAMLMSPAAL